jgi:hypothetical protein
MFALPDEEQEEREDGDRNQSEERECRRAGDDTVEEFEVTALTQKAWSERRVHHYQ